MPEEMWSVLMVSGMTHPWMTLFRHLVLEFNNQIKVMTQLFFDLLSFCHFLNHFPCSPCIQEFYFPLTSIKQYANILLITRHFACPFLVFCNKIGFRVLAHQMRYDNISYSLLLTLPFNHSCSLSLSLSFLLSLYLASKPLDQTGSCLSWVFLT